MQFIFLFKDNFKNRNTRQVNLQTHSLAKDYQLNNDKRNVQLRGIFAATEIAFSDHLHGNPSIISPDEPLAFIPEKN